MNRFFNSIDRIRFLFDNFIEHFFYKMRTRLLFIPTPSTLLWLDSPDSPEEILHAVQAGAWMPPDPYKALSGGLTAYAHAGPEQSEALVIITALPPQHKSAPEEPRISRRGREILKMLQSGLTTRQMALRLGIHPRTIYVHIADLKRILGAQTRAELVAKARDRLRRPTSTS